MTYLLPALTLWIKAGILFIFIHHPFPLRTICLNGLHRNSHACQLSARHTSSLPTDIDIMPGGQPEDDTAHNPPAFLTLQLKGVKKRRYHYFAKKYKNKRTIKNSLSFIFWNLRQITLLNFQRMVIQWKSSRKMVLMV